MRIWASTRDPEGSILSETIMDFACTPPLNADGWAPIIGELCHALDLMRPVILKKHVEDLRRFSHTYFTPSDFIESINFIKLLIEIFPEKKKR